MNEIEAASYIDGMVNESMRHASGATVLDVTAGLLAMFQMISLVPERYMSCPEAFPTLLRALEHRHADELRRALVGADLRRN